MTVTLRHNRVELALHEVRAADGPRLLLLHGLGEQSPASVPAWAEAWPGAVWALDFTGHGASTIPNGGGYTAVVLMGDVDAALEHLGPCTVLGRGLGGYVALLIAGARADAVRGGDHRRRTRALRRPIGSDVTGAGHGGARRHRSARSVRAAGAVP